LNFLSTSVLSGARELQDINLNLDDIKTEPTTFRIQTRDNPDQFKLIDYPIGEKGHHFDAEFLREIGFRRSHGIEIRTENSNICSLILEFEDSNGSYESYYQMLSFLCVRERHHCFPYVWVPKWNDVADMLNHFITVMQHMCQTELPDIGHEASWLYDPLNDFYYVVFYEGNLLVMVGETGSLDSAIRYARIVESRIQETELGSTAKILMYSLLVITLTSAFITIYSVKKKAYYEASMESFP